jgi:uncharacterized coiled-coil protein SlyX
MKTLKIYLGIILMLPVLLAGCSKKIINERIDKLEGREAVLEKTTELNQLNLELEKNLVKMARLVDDVESINGEASASARETEDLSQRLSRNPGDAKLASRAEKASRRAARDAKKAYKQNSDLNEVNDEIRDLRRDIDKTEKELSDLQSRIEFVPNNQ